MVFNSYFFWVFFALVIVAYRLLRHRGQNVLLLLASYFFYGTWNPQFLVLIWISTLVDYVAALKISSAVGRRRHVYLAISLFVNLGLLGYFKYYYFFSDQIQRYFLGGGEATMLDVVIPVGISFYTFQTLSYTIDIYRGRTEPTRSLLDFALYVSFFPQLVAGPIERSVDLLPQVSEPRRLQTNAFAIGLYHVLFGLFKKVVIADNVAQYANNVFGTPPSELTGVECLVGVYAFAIQIYCDFSGYSSIAQGLAKWMGIDLMFNFRMPYFATSPSDFWRRWHVSLSSWLKDYLYIPLGGNRGSHFSTYRNLMLTMLLGGLWHGAGWTFVAWGFFHGFILCVYRPAERRRRVTAQDRSPSASASAMGQWLSMAAFFHLVCVSWLLFRAETMQQAWEMCVRMTTNWQVSEFAVMGLGWLAFFAGPMLLYEWWVERRGRMLAILDVHWFFRGGLYSYFVLMLWFFPPKGLHEFIYFRF